MNDFAPAVSSLSRVARALDPVVLGEIVRRIVEVARPDRIILFGSGARGYLTPDSDLDFLIIKSGISHRRPVTQKIYRALVGIAVPIDVVVVTPDDVIALRDRVGTIVGPALREGREVYAA